MKVMVMVKATPASEAGEPPTEQLIKDMTAFNDELVKAGVMLAGDGLKPSSEALRVRFSGDSRTVTPGPFGGTNDIVAGYWLWEVASMDEALEWVKKCPNPMFEDSDIDIRPLYEMADFETWDATGELTREEDNLRQLLAIQQSDCRPYLMFSGCCEAALEYYQTHLGAKISAKMRFSEAPEPPPADMLAPGFEHKIMHSEFQIGKLALMGSDGCDASTKPQGFRLALSLSTKDAVEHVFAALADGGQIDMPLSPTFWSPLFGQVTDRFNIPWMVMVSETA